MNKKELKSFIKSHLGLEVEGDGNELYVSLIWFDDDTAASETISSHVIAIESRFELSSHMLESSLDEEEDQ